MNLSMNKYLEKYKEERESGSTEYESLGVAASFVAEGGTLDDLNIVYDFFQEDLMEGMEEYFPTRPRCVSTDEMKMKEAGHKLSDFI